nr:hypothetical protein [Tanacetum cinerariifolium]
MGSQSMPEARQDQLLELTAQLSALGFQVSSIAPFDTGANSHVTPDLEAIYNSKAYYGDDALHVGNDESTHTTLLTGPSKHGLYTITLPQLKSINKSYNGQPSPVSTTSIPTPPPPTPPPPPPITRQHPTNLRQNPKQRVPYNPSTNHATVLRTTITEPTSFTVANNSLKWSQAMKGDYNALMKNETWSLVHHASNTKVVDGNNKGTIDNIICQLGSNFVLKDLGPLNYFLGIEIVLRVSGILLSQNKYTLEQLQSVGLSNYNLMSSAMVTSSSLSLDDIKRILRYLYGMVEHGNLDTSLESFSNADWAGDSDDRSFKNLLEEIDFELEHGSEIVKEILSQEKVSQEEVMRHMNATFDNILEKLSQEGENEAVEKGMLVDGRDQAIIGCLEYIREYLIKRIVNVQKVIDRPRKKRTVNLDESAEKTIKVMVKDRKLSRKFPVRMEVGFLKVNGPSIAIPAGAPHTLIT